jgi:sugar lactone lactonase YvrE
VTSRLLASRLKSGEGGSRATVPEVRPTVVLDQLRFPESTRWRGDRLWLCNWLASEVLAVDPAEGLAEVMATAPVPIPFCIDWLPDGRLLMTCGGERTLLVQASDGTLESYADLSGVVPKGAINEVVVDGRGNAFVNSAGYDMMAGEDPAPGGIACVSPDGVAREVADGIHFGNGMALTPDDGTLIVAESHAARLTAFAVGEDGSLSDRRVWADLGEGAAPDGICLDSVGAVWYADVPNKRCVRVAEGGELLDIIHADRGCFACMLGGADGQTLFIAAAEWAGGAGMASPEKTGRLLAAPAPAPHAGRP